MLQHKKVTRIIEAGGIRVLTSVLFNLNINLSKRLNKFCGGYKTNYWTHKRFDETAIKIFDEFKLD